MNKKMRKQYYRDRLHRKIQVERTNRILIKDLVVETDTSGIVREDLSLSENIKRRIYRHNRNRRHETENRDRLQTV
jgi:hypothetical protein